MVYMEVYMEVARGQGWGLAQPGGWGLLVGLETSGSWLGSRQGPGYSIQGSQGLVNSLPVLDLLSDGHGSSPPSLYLGSFSLTSSGLCACGQS